MTQSASSASVGPGASASGSRLPAVPGWEHRSSGKVRDVYAPSSDGPWAGQDVLLVVASDRISAYDHILATPIPDKGKVLTALSAWWFERLADVVPGHLVSLDVPAQVAGRAMICRRLEMYPVECVARGYLTGSGLAEYRGSRSVCGVALPEGLTCLDGARAIHPTPAICGAPTEKALELIRQLESFERRYFGGLVGYMDAEGNGEWALVLRCAQVSPDEAVLYAGAGIVAESDPELEHTETGTKLGSFGRALGVETLGEDIP